MIVTLELVIILLLLLVNGVFAMSEIAVVAARKPRLQRLAQEGDTRAERALELANDPNRFLSTVQIGITLVGVSAGAFGGATLAQHIAVPLANLPGVGRYATALGIGIVVAGITYATLILGELVPKRIALYWPERIAARVAEPMHTLSRLATPLVALLGASSDLVLRLLRLREPPDQSVTEDDVRMLLEQGTRAGVFLAAEQDIVENVFWLGDQRVDAVMTPRADIVWIDVAGPSAEMIRTMSEQAQARYVLADGTLDQVVGVVAMKDVWPRVLAGAPLDLRRDVVQPLFVRPDTRALTLLEQFRTARVHVALVRGAGDRVEGLVTLTDILEGLVGEMVELAQDRVVQREDGSWLIDPVVRLTEVGDLLGLRQTPDDVRLEHMTLGGLLLHELGRVPRTADHVVWHGYRIEVMDMDGERIDKVLVAPAGAPDAGERRAESG
jgi:putative hemolysin